MAMADRQRKTYDYREAAGRFRQAGMTEAAADSVAKEFDTVLTEHSVKRDEFARLADTVDRLDTSVRELSAVVTSLKNLVEKMDQRMEKMDDRLRKVEGETLPAMELRLLTAIKDGDHNNLKWQLGSMLVFFSMVGGLFWATLREIANASPG